MVNKLNYDSQFTLEINRIYIIEIFQMMKEKQGKTFQWYFVVLAKPALVVRA